MLPVSQGEALPIAAAPPSLLAGLFRVDQRLSDWIQTKRTPATDRAAKWLKCLGDGRYSLPPLGALLAYGVIADDGLAMRAALIAVASFALTGGFVGLLQMLFHRHRPCTGATPDQFDGPRYSKHHCFPSGHASAAWSVLAAIGLSYADWPLVGICAFTLAGLTALSRLNDHAHWPSDVVVGVGIAYGIATTLVHVFPVVTAL